ncbi:uncharacterized protein LOC130780642 [Actinidia eriantha]|uniref:uncharacterized protein LOC130780642 n=1 Tax=Actinidia eriantha TaxID=165200 RepID=UPI0025888396|nr:uncharacterized protein LOC130780642 [Actinidia eriantha]
MDLVKANEWLTEMEKNFRLLRCASRWWNLKGVREPGMIWARFKVIFKEKYVPRALQNAKCAEFEQLKQTGKIITEYEAAFTNLLEYSPYLVATDEMRAKRFEDVLRYEIKRVIQPLVLPTYADVLDCTIIVEQDEMEKRKPDVICFYCNEVGHIKRNCPKLRTEAIVPRENQGGGNARSGGNCQGNQGNQSGNGNNQRQGQVFTLMPSDTRNDEIVVADIPVVCEFPEVFLEELLRMTTENQHPDHLRIVLQTLKDQRLYAKFKKCEFWLDNIVFLGHIINRDGISVDTQKIKAIMDWPQPKTVFEVRSFLGLIGYYRRFVKDFSKIAMPLTELTHKGEPFV